MPEIKINTYNPAYIAKKTIKGYRWHPEDKYWSFPPDHSTLEKLVSLFEGEKLVIDPSMHSERKSKII